MDGDENKVVIFGKRHYEFIAKALNTKMREGASSDDWIDGFVSAAEAIAQAFEVDNPRFSYKFFWDRVNSFPELEDDANE